MVKPDIGLAGKVAVVTGGSRGLGRATVLSLAQAGAAVVVAARRAVDCETVASEVRAGGGRAWGVAADIADFRTMEHLAEQCMSLAGRPQIVVVNAGTVEPVGWIRDSPPDEWARCVQVNLVGAFNTLRALLPHMATGVVILVSSGAAAHAVPWRSAYGAAKAGLEHLGWDLQAELDFEGTPIRVCTVYPGFVDTDMQATLRHVSEERFPEVLKFRRYYEQGRLRPPEEPARLIRWLVTPAAADLRGRAVNIDDPVISARVAADLGVDPL